jgi:hypothetical protein
MTVAHRIVFAFGLTFLAASAQAQTCPPNPYALTNGTTADATQVMANFNSILSCANNSLAPITSPSLTGPVTITGNASVSG